MDDFFESIMQDLALKMIMNDLDLEDLDDDSVLEEDSGDEEINDKHEQDQLKNSHKDHIKITDIKDITEDEKSKNKFKESKIDAQNYNKESLDEKSKSLSNIETET